MSFGDFKTNLPYDLSTWVSAWFPRPISSKQRSLHAALGAQATAMADSKLLLSAGWRTTSEMNTRRDPPQVLRQHPHQNDESLVDNQCIFICGVYIKGRFDTGKYGLEEEGAEGVVGDQYVTVESLVPSIQLSLCTIEYLLDGKFRYRARPSLQFSSITCWR